jgi:hypothetical protein
MCILEQTRIALDVYRYTTLVQQELILKELNHVSEKNIDSENGIIIVRNHTDSSERRWRYTSIQIIDKGQLQWIY